jgi:hypothetical protein
MNLRSGWQEGWFRSGSSDNECMRKRIIAIAASASPPCPGRHCIDVEQLAQVEVTSEDPAAPIESVFHFGRGPGWRAAEPGTQRIQLTFDQPQHLERIWLRFVETATERTQEFTLRYRELGGPAMKEIVRQQWNFSPGGSTSETEDYQVDLHRVFILELCIDPDQGRGAAFASLAGWRLT